MIEPEATLSTINEENESELSNLTVTQSENNESQEEQDQTNDERDSKTNISMHSKTFSIDSDASSYKCFKEIVMSSSSIFQNPLYFFPEIEDPGVQEALEAKEQRPSDDNECRAYKEMCKTMNIYPITKVCNSLTSEELNLKYYVPFEKQMKAICRTLENNKFIRELNLQDNWLSVESCTYLASVLELNSTLKILKMKECRIGAEGMTALSDALEASSVQELDLSFNSLGNEGLREGKSALSLNYNLTKLNLSHNEFTEDAADYLYEILTEAFRLVDLDLSWNGFNTPKSMKKLCQGLVENASLAKLNLSWNGIATEHTVFPLVRYLKKSETLEFLDLSNNLIGGASLELLLKGVVQSNSLEHLKIGNNVFPHYQAYNCAYILSRPSEKPLRLIDMENMVVQKKFLDLVEKIKEQGNEVIYGAVLADYEIHGPYLPKVLFGRCKYLGMKPKKKKNRVDFGHFVLSLPEEPITLEEFQAALASKNLDILLDSDLIAAVQNHYTIKKTRKIDCSQLFSDYMVLYPDTKPEPPKKNKPSKENKSKKNNKRNSRSQGDTEEEKKEEVRFEIDEKLDEGDAKDIIKNTSKEKTLDARASTTSARTAISGSSLKAKSSSILKKKSVSYEGQEEEKEMPNTTVDVETKEPEATLNASGVFIVESSKSENLN